MDEEASLFDLGMLQLRELLNNVTFARGKKLNVIIDYNWDANRINIRSFYFIEGAKDKNEAKEWCREATNSIRLLLGIDPSTGKPLFDGKNSVLSGIFHHGNYKKTEEPEKIGDELDNITQILSAVGIQSDSNDKLNPVICEGPLIGTKVLLAE